MNMLDFLAFLPDDLKQRLRDSVVEFVASQAEKLSGGDKIAKVIRQLSSQSAFNDAFHQAMKRALERFQTEYIVQDEDLVVAIITDGNFWNSNDVQRVLLELVRRPGAWLVAEKESANQHFASILPQRINRDRVDRAVNFLLECIIQELWTLPGIGEIREIYSLQFQKISTETALRQASLLEAQLQATMQLSADIRQALLQLATLLENHLLAAPPPKDTLRLLPYHNLFQPDYTYFIGRHQELYWLHQHLTSSDRAWQIVITGIGGVGKSALALAIAHDYRKRYHELPPEERFDAIIWISAKEEVLTITGREKAALPSLIFHTLEDMYTTIAQALEREDITRAIPGEQDHLVQKALGIQRTLLIVDNLESVTDDRVRSFLYKLPVPTKCIITSREWVDVAAVLKLTGLPLEEAEKMITEEARVRRVDLEEAQRQLLFEHTSGLPLPIKLSVARIASGETFDQVLRWLGDATGNLSEYCVKGQIDIAHHQDPYAWKLLLACSLFDQDTGASREALGVIANLSLADRDKGLTLLQRLSLLNHTENDRFWMLPLVQGHAAMKLVEADFYGELTERWLFWQLQFTQYYGANLNLHVESVSLVDVEYPNMLSAIRWCQEHKRWEMLLQLAKRIWFYLYLTGRFGDLLVILEAAVHAARELKDEQREAHFLRRLGRLYWVQEQYDKALVECLDKAEEIALRYKDEEELGRIRHARSAILFNQGYLVEAEQLAQTILEIGERLNDLELKALAAYRLSEFESIKQHFDKALEWLNQGEKWAMELDWERQLAWNMYLRGTTLIQKGATSEAEPVLLQSLSMALTWNERRLVARNKYRLAQVYLVTGRLQLALQTAEESRDLYERLGMVAKLKEVEDFLRKLPRTFIKE